MSEGDADTPSQSIEFGSGGWVYTKLFYIYFLPVLLSTISAGLTVVFAQSTFCNFILNLLILLACRRVIVKTEKAKAVEAINM